MKRTPDDVPPEDYDPRERGSALVDLIAFEFDDERCVLGVAAVNGEAMQVGKVPLGGACAALAPLFFVALPGCWEDEADCLTDLIVIHCTNMMRGHNSAGQPYPLRVSLPSS